MNYRQDKPETEINPDHVYRMAKFGCTQGEIAGVLGCSVSTISTSFCKEWARGTENMKCKLRKKQFRMAMEGNFTLLIWLGKQMLGQKEPAHELTGKDGAPVMATPQVIVATSEGEKLTKKILVGVGTEE